MSQILKSNSVCVVCLAAVTVACAATAAAAATPAAPAQPQAKAAFVGLNYSGRYVCKGDDSHEGPYTATVTLSLVREQSVARHGAYDFVMEVPGYGRYEGQAASHGTVSISVCEAVG